MNNSLWVERKSSQEQWIVMSDPKTTKLWIGTQPEPKDRTIIEVNTHDYSQIPPSGTRGVVTVTDQTTGKQVTVRRAACGLPYCLCALEFVSC